MTSTTKQTTVQFTALNNAETIGTLIDAKNTIDRTTGQPVERIMCHIFRNDYGYHLTTQVSGSPKGRRYRTYPTFGEAIVAANKWAERFVLVPGSSE